MSPVVPTATIVVKFGRAGSDGSIWLEIIHALHFAVCFGGRKTIGDPARKLPCLAVAKGIALAVDNLVAFAWNAEFQIVASKAGECK